MLVFASSHRQTTCAARSAGTTARNVRACASRPMARPGAGNDTGCWRLGGRIVADPGPPGLESAPERRTTLRFQRPESRRGRGVHWRSLVLGLRSPKLFPSPRRRRQAPFTDVTTSLTARTSPSHPGRLVMIVDATENAWRHARGRKPGHVVRRGTRRSRWSCQCGSMCAGTRSTGQRLSQPTRAPESRSVQHERPRRAHRRESGVASMGDRVVECLS